jgi:hypothetical protein
LLLFFLGPLYPHIYTFSLTLLIYLTAMQQP